MNVFVQMLASGQKIFLMGQKIQTTEQLGDIRRDVCNSVSKKRKCLRIWRQFGSSSVFIFRVIL